jgi:hypothetical protein
LLARTQNFLGDQQKQITGGKYDGILLTEGIFYHDHLMPAILSRYKATRDSFVHSYYLSYRERAAFGQKVNRVVWFERK